MTKDQIAYILGPVWSGLALAILRAQDALEELRLGDGTTVTRELETELEQAKVYLEARQSAFELDGLHAVIPCGQRMLMWPNSYPDLGQRAAFLKEWQEKHPEIAATIQRRESERASALESARAAMREKRRGIRQEIAAANAERDAADLASVLQSPHAAEGGA